MTAPLPRSLHAPHPFTLRQLQYVRAVAELRSFRRAAEACGVSQPALSVQVAQVEEILVKRRGDVRRAKLYYLRDRTGKAARIKEKI